MDIIAKGKTEPKKKINLIWASISFGFLYWIIESIRDVVLSGKGNIFERIFTPDITSFWMRILIVFILILFGVYAERLRERIKVHKRKKTKEIKKYEIIWVGFGFGVMYWMIESVRNFFLVRGEGLIKLIIFPEPLELWTRLLAICLLLLFSVYVQNLVNEQKKMEEDLREANKKLKEFDTLKSDFLSTVSHELRTPIATMREGVRLCMDERVGTLNETQKKLLSDTRSSIDRLNRLVTDLLDLSRIEEGKIKIQRSLVDLCEVIQKIHKDYIPQSQRNSIRLEIHLPNKPIKIYADQDKITQIFNNLLSNAFQYTDPGGKITIKAMENGEYVECAVIDTGAGIARENLQKLFTKFMQIGRKNGPGYKGTGLGLAISKGLVEKHEGKIWVESELGQGAAFRFTLKKVEAPKILIVDDEKRIVDVIGRFLSVDSYRIVEAYDGKKAVEMAINKQPALIVLDMNLPGMNGYEVIGRLKQDTRTQDIPVLIASGFSVDENLLHKVDDNAAIPVIGKPIDHTELITQVRELLSENR